jgi:hypothetical protein
VVHTRRNHEDTECILLRRVQAQLCGAPEQQRPYVHGRAGLVRRDVCSIHSHCELAALEEMFCRHSRDGDEGCRVLHALSVHGWPKQVDVAAWVPESLHPLVTLLSVVEARGHAVKTKEGVLDKFGRRPFSLFH